MVSGPLGWVNERVPEFVVPCQPLKVQLLLLLSSISYLVPAMTSVNVFVVVPDAMCLPVLDRRVAVYPVIVWPF